MKWSRERVVSVCSVNRYPPIDWSTDSFIDGQENLPPFGLLMLFLAYNIKLLISFTRPIPFKGNLLKLKLFMWLQQTDTLKGFERRQNWLYANSLQYD